MRSGLAWATYQKVEKREEERRGERQKKREERRGEGREKELERGKGGEGEGGGEAMEFSPFRSVISKYFSLIFVDFFPDSGPVLQQQQTD